MIIRLRFNGLKKNENKHRSIGLKIDNVETLDKEKIEATIRKWFTENILEIEDKPVKISVYNTRIDVIDGLNIESFDTIESFEVIP